MTNTTHTATAARLCARCAAPSTADSSLCSTCLDAVFAARAARRAVKFDRVLDLEAAVRLSRAARAFTLAGVPDFRKAQQAAGVSADEARLSAALDALTPAELAAFGTYRAAALRGES